MSDWRPIATAPKDGTRVLIWDNGCWIAAWREDACFGSIDHDKAVPGWQIWDCDGDQWFSCATEHATHWMPLPEPPK